MSGKSLTLQEEIFLIGLNDQTGKWHPGHWQGALNAAALAELLLLQRIAVNDDKVEVRSMAPTGDEALDVALSRLAMSRRSNTLVAWISSLYRDKKMPMELLLTRLVHRGILTIEEARVLWIFREKVYPTSNPIPEQQVTRRVRDAILVAKKVDERTAVLIALLNSCRALGLILTAEEVQRSSKRIADIYERSPVGKLLGKALVDLIAAAEQAASMDMMMTVIASSSD